VTVCLDSWAVLAWLDGDEPAATTVQEAFAAGRPWMSWLNVGEVAYLIERRHGAGEAALVLGRLRAAVALDDLASKRVLAAATATARDATLLTGDPELLDRDVGCRTHDLRVAPAG